MVNYSKKNNSKAGLLGLGFDNKDKHTRITKGDNYYLCGGSEETHEKMVETTIKFNENYLLKENSSKIYQKMNSLI